MKALKTHMVRKRQCLGDEIVYVVTPPDLGGIYVPAQIEGEHGEVTLETLDDTVRLAKYEEVQKILMDEAPWGFIAYPKYTLARKAELKGFTYYSSNNLRFQDFSRG